MSAAIPWRGPGPGRPDGLPLPPAALPPLLGGRLRKRWRYVAGFSDELMACAAYARIGPAVQAWWAVWDRSAQVLRHGGSGPLGGRAGVRLPSGRMRVDGVLDLRFQARPAVEVVSPHGGAHIWTAKQGDVALRGTVLGRRAELRGLVDDSAGYHARRTDWRWSCGIGRAAEGAAVAWNLVSGIHDAASASERTVWVDGVAHEVGPVAFAEDLSGVSGSGVSLRFAAEATRAHAVDRLVLASAYEQPFGSFSGELPGVGAVEGLGVMERHSVRW